MELAGDLVVSGERVKEQAAENGWDFDTELIRLLAHGCAHLAGWDHERSAEEAREMLELEIYLLILLIGHQQNIFPYQKYQFHH